MADTRKDKRAPAALRVKYRSATVDQFIEQSGVDISAGGIFVKTKKPLKMGALLKFEFQLSDASPVMSGVGRVAWRRPAEACAPGQIAGMGLKFLKLSATTQALVERIEGGRSGGSRFDETEGAEIAEGGMSMAPPALLSDPPPPATASGGSGAARRPSSLPPPPAVAAGGSGSMPRPAPSSAKAAGSPTSIAGVFGTSMTPTPKTASRAVSVFPKPAAAPAQASEAQQASEFLAGALSGSGGASEDTVAAAQEQVRQARQASQRPPADSEPALPADLFDEDGPGPVSSVPPPLPPSSPPSAAVEEDDPFGKMLDSLAPPPSSVPPPSGSVPPPPDPVQSAPPSGGATDFGSPLDDLFDEDEDEAAQPDPFGALADAGEDFGEVDLDHSIPPAGPDAPITSLSTAPGPDEASLALPSMGPAAEAAATGEEPKSKLGLIIGLIVVLAAAGGGYVFTQQGGAPSASSPPPASPGAPGAAVAGPAEAVAAAVPAGPPVDVPVTSTPRGASVMVGGEKRGEAPLTLSLPSGVPVEVKVQMVGFAPSTRSITPGADHAPEDFELKELSYEVVVASEPTGATISAEGQSVVAPAILKLGHVEGTVSISASKDGYRRTSRPVRIDEYKLDGSVMRASLHISLSALPGGGAEATPAPKAPAPVRKRRRKAPSSAAAAEPEELPDNPF